MTDQTETIVWKRYPENKPEGEPGMTRFPEFLVTLKFGGVYLHCFNIEANKWQGGYDEYIIAFAERPKGYREDK